MIDEALSDAVVEVGRAAGLVAVGTCSAAPFVDARFILEERRDLGLHAGMQFTYRNPARSTDVTRTFEPARSLVVGALAYATAVPPAPSNRPHARVARYATSDHYERLRTALATIGEVLEAHGWRQRVLADDNALVDRAAAHRAALGWYGKSTNLLVPGHGSWVVLGSVVTDAPLREASAAVPDGCGTCRRCLDACPTAAIVAAGVVDARRCLAWSLQARGPFPRDQREALGDRLYGCDDCQEVCPPSRRGTTGSTETDAHIESDGAWVDVLGLLDASDEDLLAAHGRWYIPGREPRYLRRNALVVLANTADPEDLEVCRALERYLADADPLLRAHAVWAARRLGMDELAGRVAGPDDPVVAEELCAPHPAPR